MFISMAWHGTVVAPVLTLWSYCSLVLGRRCEHTNWSIKICCHVAMFILMARCRTKVAPVLAHWSCCSLALRHQCQYASCSKHMLRYHHGHTNGLARHCGSSSADTLELLQSCAVPSVSVRKCFIHMSPCHHGHIDGLAWNCGGSSADTLELLQSCAVPSVSVRKLL